MREDHSRGRSRGLEGKTLMGEKLGTWQEQPDQNLEGQKACDGWGRQVTRSLGRKPVMGRGRANSVLNVKSSASLVF
jgi:hypothetical protein